MANWVDSLVFRCPNAGGRVPLTPPRVAPNEHHQPRDLLGRRQPSVVVPPGKLGEVQVQPGRPYSALRTKVTLHIGPESFDLAKRGASLPWSRESMESAADDHRHVVGKCVREGVLMTPFAIAFDELFELATRDRFGADLAEGKKDPDERMPSRLRRRPLPSGSVSRDPSVTPPLVQRPPDRLTQNRERPQHALTFEARFIGDFGAWRLTHEPRNQQPPLAAGEPERQTSRLPVEPAARTPAASVAQDP